MKELWIRLGAVIQITDAEERAIFSDDEEKMREALRTIIAEGEAVQEFNRTYGTAYEEENWCCDL